MATEGGAVAGISHQVWAVTVPDRKPNLLELSYVRIDLRDFMAWVPFTIPLIVGDRVCAILLDRKTDTSGDALNLRHPSRLWAYSALLAVLVLLTAASCIGDAVENTEEPAATPQQLPSLTDVAQENIDLTDAIADAIVAGQEQVISRIYNESLPSVTHIHVIQQIDGSGESSPFGFPSPFGDDQFRRAEGSGFIWDQDGRVVTNYHVIADADQVFVVTADDIWREAEVLGFDPDSDLAVLQMTEPPDDLAPLLLGDSDALSVGQLVIAIGNPFEQEFTVTGGIVSALERTISSGNSPFSIPKIIQTDAAINPGNSGGPLLDRTGQAIGINTQIATLSGSNSGIGFAIPINTAKQVIPALINEGRFVYAWLGITGQPVNSRLADLMNLPPNTRGALVVDVANNGPAGKAGLQGSDSTMTVQGLTYALGGDVITAIDDMPIDGINDLIAYLNQETRPGDQIVLDIIRSSTENMVITVELESRPEQS